MAKKLKTAKKTKRSPDAKAVTGEDLQIVRSMYGLSSVDLSWLMARPMHAVRLSEKGGAGKQLRDRRLSILVRLLLHEAGNPNLVPLPKSPSYEEMFAKLGKQWPPSNFKDELPETKRRKMSRDAFGMMCGVSLWSSYAWANGSKHDPIIDRLFWVVNNLMDDAEEPQAALELLAKVVDEEARSRGIVGGLGELMQKRRWQTR